MSDSQFVLHSEDAVADTGILELYDPESDDVRRIELRSLATGQIWGIGNTPHCVIPVAVGDTAQEYAALVMSPHGPMLESRSAPLWFEGRKVKQHLLFDGDHLYMGRFVFCYHNFFRQRSMADRLDDK